jgi:hypothetical protein
MLSLRALVVRWQWWWVTPGAPASPIDDYIIYLAIVGLFVIYYTYKKSNRLVKN